ncbi:MAG: hypothetical protein WA220_10385 [Candidatus Nitrosopolaris sp.]
MNAQNSTMSGGTSGNTIITTTGNKTVITTSPATNLTTGAAPVPATSPSADSAPNYNRTGFTNLYVLTINGKTFPIKYSINGGKLVSKQCERKNIIS